MFEGNLIGDGSGRREHNKWRLITEVEILDSSEVLICYD